MIYWGVDSSAAAHLPARRSLYDRVTQWRGQAPAFWGRYLRDSAVQHTNATPLTQTEVNYIQRQSQNQCRILLIYVNASPTDMRTRGNSNGRWHAERAQELANQALPSPGMHNCIFLDIEPGWSPSAEWLLGWWQGMEHGSYFSGIYGNFSHQNIPLLNAYCAALRHEDATHLVKRRYIWASQPKYIRNRDCRRPNRHVLNRTDLGYPGLQSPYGLPTSHDGQSCPRGNHPNNEQTVIWQYWGNCVPSRPAGLFNQHVRGGFFDMNLATQNGYDCLWHR